MNNFKKVLVLGAGPVSTGDACNYDALGLAAIAQLHELGVEVVVQGPNPSSLLTDPHVATKTYIEPLTVEGVRRVAAAEKPDALIGTWSGPLGLQLARAMPEIAFLGLSEAALKVSAPLWPLQQGQDLHVQLLRDNRGNCHVTGVVERTSSRWVWAAQVPPTVSAAAVEAASSLNVTGLVTVQISLNAERCEVMAIDLATSRTTALLAMALGPQFAAHATRLQLGEALQGASAMQQYPLSLVQVDRDGVSSLTTPEPPASLTLENTLKAWSVASCPTDLLSTAKASGVRDVELAAWWKVDEAQVRKARHALGVTPGFVALPSGALTLSYSRVPMAVKNEKPCVLLVGPSAHGQDSVPLNHCLTHAIKTLNALGYETVVVHADPCGTLVADRTYLAAVNAESVLDVIHHEKPVAVVLQLADAVGEALAPALRAAKVTVWGSVESVEFEAPTQHEQPEATDVDVELVCDQHGHTLIAGVLEHVEESSIHGANAAATLPPHSLSAEVIERIKDAARAMAASMKAVGLLHVEVEVRGKQVTISGAYPGAARTLPFVSKATGLALAQAAARCWVGHPLDSLGPDAYPSLPFAAVKEAVFPQTEADLVLGPRAQATGEVMGVAASVPEAFGKSQIAAGTALPSAGMVLFSVQDEDKPAVVDLARRLIASGFQVAATSGTYAYLAKKHLSVTLMPREQVMNRLAELAIMVLTEGSSQASLARQAARRLGISLFTTVEAARLCVAALEVGSYSLRPLQHWHAEVAAQNPQLSSAAWNARAAY